MRSVEPTRRDDRRHGTHRPRRILAVLLVGAAAAAGCGTSEPSDPVAAASPAAVESSGLVSASGAAQLASEPDVAVIDVRTPEEFAEGHLDGATLIDFSDDAFADEIAALDPSGRYLVYCRSGNRSGQAVALMHQLGFDRVYDLDGGVLAWSAAGLPLSP